MVSDILTMVDLRKKVTQLGLACTCNAACSLSHAVKAEILCSTAEQLHSLFLVIQQSEEIISVILHRSAADCSSFPSSTQTNLSQTLRISF